MTVREEFWSTARKTAFAFFVTAVLAGANIWFWGAWGQVKAIWHLPDAVEHNRLAIEALRVPRRFFEFSERSGPVFDACISGRPCEMVVRLRRFEEALDCEIVGDGVEYFYRNPRTNEKTFVDILAGTPRDVGTEWVNLPFTFETPYGLPPSAELCVSPEYRKCPGMTEGSQPISQGAECFEVPVKDPPVRD